MRGLDLPEELIKETETEQEKEENERRIKKLADTLASASGQLPI